MDELEGHWGIDLTPDRQAVQITLSHMGEDGVDSFMTAMPREEAICLASSILNAALDICICGRCED